MNKVLTRTFFRQTLAGELVDHHQYLDWTTIMRSPENEVVAQHMIPRLWPKSYARTIVAPQPAMLRLAGRHF